MPQFPDAPQQPQATPQPTPSAPAPVSSPEPQIATPASGGMSAQQQEAANQALGLLQQRGFDTSGFQSDDQFYDYLGQTSQRMAELEQLASYGQQFLPYANEFQKWQQEQAKAAQAQQAQQPAAAPEPEPYWPKPPEWNADWEKFLAVDDAGNVMIRPEYRMMANPNIVQQFMTYQNWRKGRMEALLQDPAEAIWPGIEKRISEMADKLSSERLTAYQQQQFANSWAIQNEDLLYLKGQDGRVLADPRTGQKMLSPFGQHMVANIQRLEAAGVTDPVQQAQMATEMTWAQVAPMMQQQQQMQAPPPPAAMPAPASQADAMREAFLANTPYAPNRGGTVNQTGLPQVTQNDQASFADRLRTNAASRGLF